VYKPYFCIRSFGQREVISSIRFEKFALMVYGETVWRHFSPHFHRAPRS